MGHTLEGEQTKNGGGDKASLFHLVYSLKNYKGIIFIKIIPSPFQQPDCRGGAKLGRGTLWGKAGKGDQSGDPGYAEETSAMVTEWLFRDSLFQQIGQSSLHPEQGYQTICGHSGERMGGGGASSKESRNLGQFGQLGSGRHERPPRDTKSTPHLPHGEQGETAYERPRRAFCLSCTFPSLPFWLRS